MRITFVTRKFGNVARNSHCDVLHITPIRVARLVLDCNGVFAIKAYIVCSFVFACIFTKAIFLTYTEILGLRFLLFIYSCTFFLVKTGVMCNTSQCELRSLRVNSGMLNVMCIVTYYTLSPIESPDSFWIAIAFSR